MCYPRFPIATAWITLDRLGADAMIRVDLSDRSPDAPKWRVLNDATCRGVVTSIVGIRA